MEWDDLINGIKYKYDKVNTVKCKCGSLFSMDLVKKDSRLMVTRECVSCGFKKENISPSDLLILTELCPPIYCNLEDYKHQGYKMLVDYCSKIGNIEDEVKCYEKCMKHKREYKYICSDCEVSLCEDCMKSEHSQHKYIFIDDYINSHKLREKENFKNEIFDVNNKRINEFCKQMKAVKTIKGGIQTNYDCERKEHLKCDFGIRRDNLCLYVLYLLMRTIYFKYKYSNMSHVVLKNFENYSRFRIPTRKLFNLDERKFGFCALNGLQLALARKIESLKDKLAEEESIFRSYFADCYILGTEDVEISDEVLKKMLEEEPIIDSNFYYVKELGPYGDNHKVHIKSMLLTSENHFLVSSEHTTIKSFKLEKRKLETVMKYKSHTAGVNSLALSSNKKYFYSASDDKTVIRWNLCEIGSFQFTLIFKIYAKDQNPKILTDHKDKVIQVMTLEDGLFCSCSLDKTINFYQDLQVDDQPPTLVKSVSVEGGNIIAMGNLENGQIITVSDDKKIKFYDYKEYMFLDELSVDNIECGGPECIKVNEGKCLIGGGNKIFFIDINSKQLEFTYANPEFTVITYLRIITNKHLFCATNVGIAQIGKTEDIWQMISKTDRMLIIPTKEILADPCERNKDHYLPIKQILSLVELSKDYFVFAQEDSILGTIAPSNYY